MRPNVLLIVFDTARADAFEPYGAASGTTPVAADLARRGRAVPLTIAGANWTMPSHASMFTGVLPRALGLSQPLEGPGLLNPHKVLEANTDRILAEVLRRNGYATAGVSCNPWIHRTSGFSIGFDQWLDVRGEQRRRQGTTFRDRLAYHRQGLEARVDEGASGAGEFLRERLREHVEAADRRPFFWFANLMECHSPYLPQRPWNDLSPIGRLRATAEAFRYERATVMAQYCMGDTEIPDGALGRMRYLYGRAVSMMDHWLGALLEDLDRAQVLEDTIVILTSDHGENLGEHHMLGHGLSLDQRLIHVPFVMAGPADPPAEDPFGLPDLPRLLAGRIGLRDHPWTHRGAPPGTAIAQNDHTSFWDDEQIARMVRTWGGEPDSVKDAGPWAAIVDARFKLYRNGGTESLFDLDADPLETRDVAIDQPEKAAELRAKLDAVQQDVGHEHREAYTPQEQAEMEDRLEQLGYL